MNRIVLINEQLGGRGRYLEIGVRNGRTFWQIKAPVRVGVDPAMVGRKLSGMARATQVKRTVGFERGVLMFATTSDDFFERAPLRRMRFDCILVDGLHTADQAYRDVEHALQCLAPRGLIVMHDCNPLTPVAAAPSLEEAEANPDYAGTWNGDVWKAVLRLRTRDDIHVRVLDADEGLGLVTPGTPDSVLQLSDTEINRLSFADLEQNRAELLNLVLAPH